MNREIFNFLKNYSSDPFKVDCLIVSSFLSYQSSVPRKNNLLLSHLIDKESEDYKDLSQFNELVDKNWSDFNFENLIGLFEFVISPSDKIINGAIYTPSFIRDFIVTNQFNESLIPIEQIKCCDISCGCGGFLLTLTKNIRSKTSKPFFDIYKNNIYGLDITEYSLIRSKLLLSLYAFINGEDQTFEFNLFQGNALSFDWNSSCPIIAANGGFDIISGNPPYVASRNMDSDSLALLDKWCVTASGHPDLYIPFFQIGFELLARGGSLGYITVNTFLKSINGRALREYFADSKPRLTIINFGGEQIFKGRNTYTCICLLNRTPEGVSESIKYTHTSSSHLLQLRPSDFLNFEYEQLVHKDGWNLARSEVTKDFICKIENTGIPFKNLFVTRNGIATLKNDVYKFTPLKHDDEFYYFKNQTINYKIERAICRDLINANKIKSEDDLVDRLEKIIFPYSMKNGKLEIIAEKELKDRYPFCYAYLLENFDVLATRDKGKRKYETWYAFGRRQSMDINAYKLFFPHISHQPKFVISKVKNLLFYNGIAVISDNLHDLEFLKVILESNIFNDYIKLTSKDYAAGFMSLSKNYLKNFGIVQLTENQKKRLIESPNRNELLAELYGLK